MQEKQFTLSPSTVNLFIKDPALFIMKHFYKMTSSLNIYAIRGQAVEMAVNERLKGKSLEESVNIALDFYYEQTFDLPVDTLDIEYILPQWAEKAVTTLTTINGDRTPLMQTKLEFEINGMPFKAFLDYDYTDETIDLKTCTKLPGIVSRGDRKGFLPADKRDNVRQQCIYRKATGKKASLLFITNEEHQLYTIQDSEYEMYMEEVNKVIEEIQVILTKGNKYATTKYRPNEKLFNTFYWNKEMIQKAKEIWNIKDDFDL